MIQRIYFILSFFWFSFLCNAQNGSHLNFSGLSNSNVFCGNYPSNQISGGQITLEAWIRVESFQPNVGDGNIINKLDESSPIFRRGYKLSVGGSGQISFRLGVGSGSLREVVTPINTITTNTWYHIAATYNGSLMTIYVNGNAVSFFNTTGVIANGPNNLILGNNQGGNGGFDGDIDEVRIWDAVRSQTEIATYRYNHLGCNETGLKTYYQFNQGVSGGNNLGESTLIAKVGENGTLTNFDLNGSSSNWMSGSPVSPVSLTGPIVYPVNYSLGDIATPLTAASGGMDLLWYTTATGGIGSTDAPIPSTATLGSTSYWVSSTDVNGCESDRIEIVVTVTVNAPRTSSSTQIYTGDDKDLTSLQITGSNIQWYDAPTGGILLPNTTLLIDETTYYASQTVVGIESTDRLAIKVNKISENTQLLAVASTVANLNAMPSIGTTSRWFTTATGGTALENTDFLANGTYYVEQFNNEYIQDLGSGFFNPNAVAVQSDGKILVADTNNNAIKRMDPDGTNIVTLGSGFNWPNGVAVQADGKILVADTNNNAIKCMDADGSNIVTLGSGFGLPYGVAVQADGKILIADTGYAQLKRMDADGTNIITLGPVGSTFAVAVDPIGKIIVAGATTDNIKRMDADGTNVVILGSGFDNPSGVAVQSDGKIIVADSNNNALKIMDAIGTNINMLSSGFGTSGVTIQDNGNILVTDRTNNVIKRIVKATISNRVPVQILIESTPAPSTTLATQVFTGDDKDLTALQVTGNTIQWYDAVTGGALLPNTTLLIDGTTYYATQILGIVESIDRLAVTVKRISDNTQLLPVGSTVADLNAMPSTGTTARWFTTATGGTASESTDVISFGSYYVEQFNSENIPTLGSGFSNPFGVAVQTDAKIVVADYGNNSIKRMDADGTNVVTLGSGFNGPFGVAVQADGKILVADAFNNAIKRMDADGTNIVTLGTGFSLPRGVAVQTDGKIVVADTDNGLIKRMDADGTNIIVLGSGFYYPTGVAIKADGKIVVADTYNNAIKRMDADGTNIVTLGTGFIQPHGVAIQTDGKIVVTDALNNAIKRMDADGTNIVTLGSGFNSPRGVAVQSDGKIVLADFGNNAIKRIIEATISNRVPVQVIEGCSSTTWNGVSWSNGTPDSNKAAIFDSNYTINANIHVCKLEVNNNANVTLSSGITLNVNNEIVVATNGNLTVENDAIILQNNPDAINTGNVVVNRNSVPMIRLDYTAWSSPVSGQNLLSFSPNTLTNRFYTYDSSGTNTATSWVSIDPSSTNFSEGIGYLIRVANNWSSVNPASYLGTFNGVPNNGSIANPVGIGYNLIGNPYPSPINADLFLTDNSGLGVNTLYFWTHVAPQNGSYTAQSNYASYNTVGGVAASAGGAIPDGVIQVGQGFFHNVSTAGNVTFNNNQRSGTSNGQFFKSSQTSIVERHRIWLSLKDDSIEYNQFLVAYMDGATDGLDLQYDGKLFTNAASKLSSLINNEEYVIQAKTFPFNDNDEVELNFVADHIGNYTISLDNFDGLFGSQDVFLWDKTLNIYHNLKLNNYSFVSVSGSFNNRFSIVYKTNTLSNEEFENQEQVSIFMNNSNQIVIKNYSCLIDNVEIFDLTGRLLYAKTNWGDSEFILENNFSTNVLLVRTNSKNNNLTTSKLIKK